MASWLADAAAPDPAACEDRLSVIAISSLTGRRLDLSSVRADVRLVDVPPRDLEVAERLAAECLARPSWAARRRRCVGASGLVDVDGEGCLLGCL